MPKDRQMGHDEFYAAVGSNVRSKRTESGMSQSMLANRIGFTRSSVANLEAGRQRIALHLFVKIEQALDCQPGDLLPSGLPAAGEDLLSEVNDSLADESDTTQDFVRGAVAHLVASDMSRQN
jgi:transcriptional regulator with XRE-family HTH domain